GISGLAVGWFLKQKWGNQIDLTILEKSERAGGWIRTMREGEFLFEAGPRGFRPSGRGEATLELVKALGLEGKLVAGSQESKRRYICLGGKLHRFGMGFLLRQGVLGAVLHDLFTPKSVLEDETIADFVTRRFNQRLAENVMDPLTKGVFGGDMHALSMRSCFPCLWRLEQEYGSVVRGMFAKRKGKKRGPAALYSFQGGMETLTRALAKELQSELQIGKMVNSIDEIQADLVISTLPAYALAALLGYEDPCTYGSLSLVHLGWNNHVLPKKGYGFLVPSQEKGEILGMTWDSEIFPHGSQTRVCVMVSGKLSEQELTERALRSLKRYVGIETPPDVQRITVAERAFTQYTLHHDKRMEAFKQRLPAHVKAIGTSFGGPGVNDAIFGARACVHDLSF
ncbi:protoporphyrinogen oxidase, partial [Chlamydiota bacterium]